MSSMSDEDRKNLLQETLQQLKDNDHTPGEVLSVVYHGLRFTWKMFALYAKLINYDCGYGGANIPDFKIKGDSWWLERASYDGAEWWTYKTLNTPDKRMGTAEDMEAIFTHATLPNMLTGTYKSTIAKRRKCYAEQGLEMGPLDATELEIILAIANQAIDGNTEDENTKGANEE